MKRRGTLFLLLFLLAFPSMLMLGGCARLSSLIRPEPPAPAAASAERSVSLRMHAASSLNTDSRGHPLTLVTRVLKLRQRAAFEQAPFDVFLSAATEREALGSDLVEAREVVLTPNQRYEVLEKLGPEVAYIGIVSLFHSPAPQRWRLAFASSAAQSGGITVGVHGCALSVGAGAAATTVSSQSPPACR